MSDPRIAQLRAKADSTTFPAEAAALRAKADELEAREPKRQRSFDPLAARTEAWRQAAHRAAAQAARERTSRPTQRITINFGGMGDSARLATEMMAKMEATMKEADARIAARRAADRAGRTTVTVDGVVYTKVTGVNGLSYWTRTE